MRFRENRLRLLEAPGGCEHAAQLYERMCELQLVAESPIKLSGSFKGWLGPDRRLVLEPSELAPKQSLFGLWSVRPHMRESCFHSLHALSEESKRSPQCSRCSRERYANLRLTIRTERPIQGSTNMVELGDIGCAQLDVR